MWTGPRHRSRIDARSIVIVVAACAMAALYMSVASYIVFGLHIGHVVQDGVDTGDMLGLLPTIAATACVVFAAYTLAGARQLVPAHRRSRRLVRTPVAHPTVMAAIPTQLAITKQLVVPTQLAHNVRFTERRAEAHSVGAA